MRVGESEWEQSDGDPRYHRRTPLENREWERVMVTRDITAERRWIIGSGNEVMVERNIATGRRWLIGSGNGVMVKRNIATGRRWIIGSGNGVMVEGTSPQDAAGEPGVGTR